MLIKRFCPYFTLIHINSNSHWVGGSTNPSNPLSSRSYTDSCIWSALTVWRGRRWARSSWNPFCLTKNLQVDSEHRKNIYNKIWIQLSQPSCAALGKTCSRCLLHYMICNIWSVWAFLMYFFFFFLLLKYFDMLSICESAICSGDFALER